MSERDSQTVSSMTVDYVRTITQSRINRRKGHIAHIRFMLSEYDALLAKVAKLETGIKKFIEGDYPCPRSYRPNTCPHDQDYWLECAECNDDYLQSLLPTKEQS